VRLAQDAGVRNINLDLMYALPGPDAGDGAARRRARGRAAAAAPVALPAHAGAQHGVRGEAAAGIPAEDDAWDMQERCIEAMAAAGYAQYEVSPTRKPDRQCAHNLNYWRFGDYLGIGAGAHGKLTLGATQRSAGAGR
jgi:oxygen-independent coproporphyrinogen-3 oxidase